MRSLFNLEFTTAEARPMPAKKLFSSFSKVASQSAPVLRLANSLAIARKRGKLLVFEAPLSSPSSPPLLQVYHFCLSGAAAAS